MVEEEGLWDPEPLYDTDHPDFIAAFNAADSNSDGLISRDEASMWFGVAADSLDDFWDYYVTKQDSMNVNQAVWAFNDWNYSQGWFYVMKELTLECDEFHEILYNADTDKDGKIGMCEMCVAFDCESGCTGGSCVECEAMMNHYDGDGDGFLCHEEMLTAVNDERFERGYFDPENQSEEEWKAELHAIIEERSSRILEIVGLLQDPNF